MFNTLINTYYHILFKSNNFISFANFGFFTFSSIFNSDNNSGPFFFNNLSILNSCNNVFETSLVHYVGISVVDFNSSTINSPSSSEFYTITYCSSFDNYSYNVDFLISDEPLSANLIDYLVYILNISFNLTGSYFYTGFFSASYLQDYNFFTLVTSPNYINIYLVNKENCEMYVNLLNTGGLYVLDYDVYPNVISSGSLSFSSNPISYSEVPLSNIITSNHIESFTSSEIEVALTSDYDNKFYKNLTGHLKVNHWDLTQEGYIFCPNKSTFFSSYYKEPFSNSLTIASATSEINNSLNPVAKKKLNPLTNKSLPLVSNNPNPLVKNINPLTSAIFYLVNALNMSFNISGSYFYYEGLDISISGAKFYPYGFSSKKVPFIKVYNLSDSNLKDFLMVLKYGTKNLDVEFSFCMNHIMTEYDGTVKNVAINNYNMIHSSIVEYYFCHKINSFIQNQFKPHSYGSQIPLVSHIPNLPSEEEGY